MTTLCPQCSCPSHDGDGPWVWRICAGPDCFCLRANDALGRPVLAPRFREEFTRGMAELQAV